MCARARGCGDTFQQLLKSVLTNCFPKHSVYYPPTYLPLPAHYRWPSSSSSSSPFAFLLFFSQFSSDAAAAAAALDHWLSPSIHFLFYTFFLLVFYARGINGDGGGGGGGHCLHAIVAFFFLFFFVSRLLREGGVAQWNSRFLTIRITLPLFYSCFTYLPLIMCVRLMAVSVPCLAAAAAAGNVYLNVRLVLLLVLLLLLYQNRKKVSKRGRKERKQRRQIFSTTNTRQKSLASFFFLLPSFLSLHTFRARKSASGRSAPFFLLFVRRSFAFLLPRLQTRSFLSCFSVLFSSFLWISTHFDCCTESVCWLGSEHARTHRLLMIDFFAVEKEREKEKELLLFSILCCSTALPIIFLLYLADRFNPIKWPLTFSLAFSPLARSLLRRFYLLLVLHSFKKVCTPFFYLHCRFFRHLDTHAR